MYGSLGSALLRPLNKTRLWTLKQRISSARNPRQFIQRNGETSQLGLVCTLSWPWRPLVYQLWAIASIYGRRMSAFTSLDFSIPSYWVSNVASMVMDLNGAGCYSSHWISLRLASRDLTTFALIRASAFSGRPCSFHPWQSPSQNAFFHSLSLESPTEVRDPNVRVWWAAPQHSNVLKVSLSIFGLPGRRWFFWYPLGEYAPFYSFYLRTLVVGYDKFLGAFPRHLLESSYFPAVCTAYSI